MKLYRVFFFPLLLAFVLLFAQQAGAVHSLHHALEDLTHQQEDKQAPHSYSCEKCADYVQLSNALGAGTYDFILLQVSDETILHRSVAIRSIPFFAPSARDPPRVQQIA